ncbi:MAG: NUDIX hydrolase [Burkholderiales bacterium]|nr:NUDIX hydrolase [Burkholderiales bacterium]
MDKISLPAADFTETTLSSKPAYDGALLKVREDEVRLPDGKSAKREYVEHPGAVIIVAQLNNGDVLLERQFRYPLRRHMIELPAGKIEPNEDPLLTAQRELQEETGYTARDWRHLFTAHPCIGYSNERMEFYQATGLTLQGRQLDEGEFLQVFTLPLEDALALLQSGGITDIKTIVGLYWLERCSARYQQIQV